MGEPAGIGIDVILEAWSKRQELALPAFFVCSDEAVLRQRASALSILVPTKVIDHPSEAHTVFSNSLPVIALDGKATSSAGSPSANDPPMILQSLEHCISYCLDGAAGGLITSPINKAALYNDGFPFQGHTDFLANRLSQLTGDPVTELMMLCSPSLQPPLRVVPATIHTPLHMVAKQLTTDEIVKTGLQLHRSLIDDFGITTPRIAAAGLNPHAGEEGALGHEEQKIITPAIDMLSAHGVGISGPYPADTLFHADARSQFDAIICMYHDQALIPLKTLDFHGGVNVTLGLPIVRTSPDHGTGFDIAGTGKARPDSMIAALRMADTIAQSRREQRGAP